VDVTQPALNTYNFQPATSCGVAQANGMRVRGHNLCWHTQFPSWLQPYASSSTTTPADMATLLQNHITTEVTHFAGKVFAWDVVNEAFTDTTPSVLGDSIWYDQPGIGPSGTGYIEQRSVGRTQPIPTRCCFITTTASKGRAPSSTPF